MKTYTNGNLSNEVYYRDNIEIRNNDVIVNQSDGRVVYTNGGGAGDYQYYLKDHLGNVTLTFTACPDQLPCKNANLSVISKNHYYPFGMKMEGYWNDFNSSTAITTNQYNGKEWVDDLGLAMNDYGARWYDPATARWNSVDPLAEKYVGHSPYNYVLGNPVKYIDPDGRDVITVNEKGLIQSIKPAEGNHRFYDKYGVELFFNDADIVDKDLLTSNFREGDRIYWPVSSKDFMDGILFEETFNPLFHLYSFSPSKAFDRLLSTAANSYGGADFTENYLTVAFPISDMGHSNRGQNYLDNSGYFRFGGDNTIYNLYDAGNFMWGFWMKLNGYSINASLRGANWNNRFFHFGEPDSQADQRAIKNGFLKKWVK